MQEVVTYYKTNWWMYLVQGIVSILFGIAAVFNPDITTAILGFYFGLFILVAGLGDLTAGIVGTGKRAMSWAGLLLGGFEIGIGVYLLRRPALALATFIAFIAITLLVRGIVAVVEAFDNAIEGGTRALRLIGGIAGVLAGIIIWRYPVRGSLAFVWVLGLYALLTGPILIAFALEAKHGFSK